jgi:hypothetical protein
MIAVLPQTEQLHRNANAEAAAAHSQRVSGCFISGTLLVGLGRSAAQRRPLSRGSNPCGYPHKPLVSYRINGHATGPRIRPWPAEGYVRRHTIICHILVRFSERGRHETCPGLQIIELAENSRRVSTFLVSASISPARERHGRNFRHAGAAASSKLTFNSAHSMKAG